MLERTRKCKNPCLSDCVFLVALSLLSCLFLFILVSLSLSCPSPLSSLLTHSCHVDTHACIRMCILFYLKKNMHHWAVRFLPLLRVGGVHFDLKKTLHPLSPLSLLLHKNKAKGHVHHHKTEPPSPAAEDAAESARTTTSTTRGSLGGGGGGPSFLCCCLLLVVVVVAFASSLMVAALFLVWSCGCPSFLSLSVEMVKTIIFLVFLLFL